MSNETEFKEGDLIEVMQNWVVWSPGTYVQPAAKPGEHIVALALPGGADRHSVTCVPGDRIRKRVQ